MKKSDFLDMVKDTEKNQLGLDFDGVIYKNSKGFHDGTMYDGPIDGATESLKHLNYKYKVETIVVKIVDVN